MSCEICTPTSEDLLLSEIAAQGGKPKRLEPCSCGSGYHVISYLRGGEIIAQVPLMKG
jgi:hypothetical protein